MLRSSGSCSDSNSMSVLPVMMWWGSSEQRKSAICSKAFSEEMGSTRLPRILSGNGFGGGRGRGFKFHGDEAGNTELGHGDAVEHVRQLHRALIVRNDDKLRLLRKFFHHADKTAHVGLIQRRVDFIQKTERTGLDHEKGKK